MHEGSEHTNIRGLPEAGEVRAEDFLILETEFGTQIVEFKNFLIGEDNITFQDRLSSLDSGVASSIARTSTVTAAMFGGGENLRVNTLTALVGLSSEFMYTNQMFISGHGLKIAGPLSTNGAIYVGKIYGDGSALTNLPTSSSGGGWVRPVAGTIRTNTLTDKVGIGTTAPSHMLDVAGAVSAQTIVYAGQEYNTGYKSGDSRQWVSTYETVKAASAAWETAGGIGQNSLNVWTQVNYYSGAWNQVYNHVQNVSSTWNNTYLFVGANSALYSSTHTDVFNNSALWEATHTDVYSNSSYWSNTEWASVYATVSSLSSKWTGVWTVMNEVSHFYDLAYDYFEATASGASIGGVLADLSAQWNSTHTDVNANSAFWALNAADITNVAGNSAAWASTNTDVFANSASWNATNLAVNAQSASWSDGGAWSFVLEDDDGTEVTISQDKEIAFRTNGNIDIDYTDTVTGSDGDPYVLTFTNTANIFKTVTLSGQNVAAAIGPDVIADSVTDTLTLSAGPNIALISDPTTDTVTISSVGGQHALDINLLATDIKIGEDNETKIDFETANEIHFFAGNQRQADLKDGSFGPTSDSDVDLGTTGVRWKDGYFDTVTTTSYISAGAASSAHTCISAVGVIAAGGDIIAFTTSDERLKDDIRPLTDTTYKIGQLRGVEFEWNSKSGKAGNDVGVIAQDVEEVMPQAVTERDDTKYKAVNYEKLIPLLVEGVKELTERIEKLEDRVL